MKSFLKMIPLFCIGFTACSSVPFSLGQYDYIAYFAETPPVIDGVGNDPAWEKAEWRPIDQVWLGGGNASASNLTPPPAGTYSGRFKIVWTEDRLYYLVEILDTHLSLTRINDPFNEIYNDDCLELFINEDGKGGMHENNNNAFAYHLSYDGINVMDYVSGQGGNPNFRNGYIARNHHINYAIGNRNNADRSNVYTWEIEMKVFDKNYPIGGNVNYPPVRLTDGKTMGFAVAYCNAGTSNRREYFMGSAFIEGANKNVAYQNAGVFAKLILSKTKKPADSASSIVSLVNSTGVTDVRHHTYASIKALVDEAIEIAGGLEGIVKFGDTVVLKPNVITTVYGWAWPSGVRIPAGAPDAVTPTAPNGIVTDWRVVQAVAENVRMIIGAKGQPGAGKILVMESSGKGNSAQGTATQYANVNYTLANLSAVDEILTLDTVGGAFWTNPNPDVLPSDILKIKLDNPAFDTPFNQSDFGGNPMHPHYTSYDGQGNYFVAKQMYEADALICIPVLKLHTTAGTTGTIKNISIGASPPRIYGNSSNDIGRNFRIPHTESNGLHKWIADYYAVMPADFTVMEALQGVDRGPLPPAGDASALKRMNSMLASRDGLAIDVVMSNIIKVDYTKVGHLAYLTNRGEVGTKPGKRLIVRGNPSNITVLGNIKVQDLREGVNFHGSIMSGLGGNISSTRLSARQLERPAVSITSAQFNRQNLNLNLAVSANTVKADIFINGVYKESINDNFDNIIIGALNLGSGSYNITVYAYTNYMAYGEASVTAVKTQ
ncbi:MAG: DUF362 domain-containing protein [Treponema sp.]|nr:DUF362 domain-containing protein [Treponema sp.]MCL2237597.1 DUF362 domain-containing protein [Treponema sp.]